MPFRFSIVYFLPVPEGDETYDDLGFAINIFANDVRLTDVLPGKVYIEFVIAHPKDKFVCVNRVDNATILVDGYLDVLEQ